MKLEYPLNAVLPNVERTRDRLLAKVFEFRRSDIAMEVAKDEDYELLYTYGMSPSYSAVRILACMLTRDSTRDRTAGPRSDNYWTGDRKAIRCA